MTAWLVMGPESPSSAAESEQRRLASRFGDLRAELVRQLEAEPDVLGVAVTASVPGAEPWVHIEVDGSSRRPMVCSSQIS